ncbi:PREDICTED: centlein-like [Myotis davidii]|uniref:centlein-like n=1 Tax=Myotis davidii TaxID=225400 RepID=UPI0007672207|nr:PREDICTED: centlein-like [Myotis davidii]
MQMGNLPEGPSSAQGFAPLRGTRQLDVRSTCIFSQLLAPMLCTNLSEHLKSWVIVFSGTRSSRVGRGAAVHAVSSEASGLGGEGVVDRGDIPWPSGEGSGGQRGPGGSAPAQAPLLRAPPGSERLEGISVEEVMVARMQLLEEELSSLKEELALCQADKEFVWSLWKRLQVTNPDITQTVSLIVERRCQLKLETQTHNFDGALGRELAHTVGDDP